MSLIEDLHWRGLIYQATDEEHLPRWLEEGTRTLYAGFDPTAESLHVGSLMPLLLLRRFQKAGHKPLAVLGGATGMIGDPSGKSEERNLQTTETIERNVAGIRRQMEKLLDFAPGPQQALLLNNHEWVGPWSYLDFLRDIGKNFPVSAMLAKDSVKSRLGRDSSAENVGISYTEFSYMLLQAFDFVYLSEHYGCELQVGGSDQWGNITAGIELGRRMRGVQLYGITSPLLTKSDGTKMGKTESGAVWLSPERTSPYQFYQYWINVEDADAGRCLRMLTELSREEIEELDRQRAERPEGRQSQRRLAEELTRLIHGEEGLQTAQRATDIFFGAEISDLDDRQLLGIFADVPSAMLPRERLSGEGIGILDAFVESGLAKTKGEARRTVQQGGAYVNNRRVDLVDHVLTPSDLAGESTIVLRSGKKKYALLRFE